MLGLLPFKTWAHTNKALLIAIFQVNPPAKSANVLAVFLSKACYKNLGKSFRTEIKFTENFLAHRLVGIRRIDSITGCFRTTTKKGCRFFLTNFVIK